MLIEPHWKPKHFFLYSFNFSLCFIDQKTVELNVCQKENGFAAINRLWKLNTNWNQNVLTAIVYTTDTVFFSLISLCNENQEQKTCTQKAHHQQKKLFVTLLTRLIYIVCCSFLFSSLVSKKKRVTHFATILLLILRYCFNYCLCMSSRWSCDGVVSRCNVIIFLKSDHMYNVYIQSDHWPLL